MAVAAATAPHERMAAAGGAERRCGPAGGPAWAEEGSLLQQHCGGAAEPDTPAADAPGGRAGRYRAYLRTGTERAGGDA
eukprot:gene3133-2213_t